MNISIEVGELQDRQDISFLSISLSHRECKGLFAKHRQGLTENYTLRCICGLTIILNANEGAKELIEKIAVGAEATELMPGTYSCNRTAESVFVLPAIPAQGMVKVATGA